MEDRGWKMGDDTKYIYHPKMSLMIKLAKRNGLYYLPHPYARSENCDAHVKAIDAAEGVISFRKPWTTALRYYVVFGGPDLAKLRKTSEIAGLKLAGTIPSKIREFRAAKMQRNYPRPDPPTVYGPFECITWDMLTFKSRSVDKMKYSHNAVDRNLKFRWACPVPRADTDCFLDVLN